MTATSLFPASGGTYILLVELASPIAIAVGRLGPIPFDAGVYAYVGSAFGPGGLAARLHRYIVGPRKIHWHIDHLLGRAEVIGALHRADLERRECNWARWVGNRAKAHAPGFGSSDCRCESHLFFIGDTEKSEDLVAAAGCELKAIVRSEVNDGL
jgi:Uri superfamily endonuclease